MTTGTTTESAAKKDTQKLQRAIVDGLEDVKAQDIQVFNTEHLSPLFERVIVASGTSNRQTRALAASVRDAVREAGFNKPRVEGEDNGEWIIVDCGPAVVHIMQPSIRQYYHLEELWGEKPVRLKLGAPKPVASVKTVAQPAAGTKAPAKKAAAKKATASTAPAAKKSSKGASSPSAAPATKRASAKTPARATAPVKTLVVGKPVKKAATAKSAAKPAAKKAVAKKPSARG